MRLTAASNELLLLTCMCIPCSSTIAQPPPAPPLPQVVIEALERQALYADQGTAVARYQLAADFLLTWDEWRRAAAAHLGLARRLRAQGVQDAATLAEVQAAYGETLWKAAACCCYCCAPSA